MDALSIDPSKIPQRMSKIGRGGLHYSHEVPIYEEEKRIGALVFEYMRHPLEKRAFSLREIFLSANSDLSEVQKKAISSGESHS